MIRFLLSGLLLASALPGVAAASDLTRGEIADELVGRQIVWWEDSGWRQGHLFLMPDGTAEMTVDNPRPARDIGRWALRGDEICTRWSEMRDGTEKCYRVRRGEAGYFLTTGGNVFAVRELGA